MLIDIETDKVIERIPYRKDFEALRVRISDAEFDQMVDRINELIDASGGEIATAGWLPGSDWTGTPFEPIYAKAARGDFQRAALFFGQLVWYTVMNRPERWASGRYQVDGRDIGSRTYFRIAKRASLMPDELDAFVTDYFADWKALLADQTGRVVPDGDRPWDLLHDLIMSGGDVEEAWPLILALIERAPDEEARSFVAAGPLEDLIRGHGDRFADRLIEQGRGNARFREALTGVWGIEELNEPLRGRIIDLLTG